MDLQQLSVYAQLVNDYLGKTVYNIDKNEKEPLVTPIYRVTYPEEWYTPVTNSCYERCFVQHIKYVPYKRISHFREHLNRLQYCQYITIPSTVWITTCHTLSHLDNINIKTYFQLKEGLKRSQLSKYNEHIHYLISKYYRLFLQFSDDDYTTMCVLFQQLDHSFTITQHDMPRKNIFSYYLVVQLILYLFHYHPYYKLPTINDVQRRNKYYIHLLNYLVKCPLYEKILFIHFQRKKTCSFCIQKDILFDDFLCSLL